MVLLKIQVLWVMTLCYVTSSSILGVVYHVDEGATIFETLGTTPWGGGGLTDLGDVMHHQKSLHESCRMGRRSV